ncbi:hypothetical protein HDU77_006065 [Chytriomyces hyalinus]|nr:hypothetical protein HDU77_006065 [Chytriomyces hyalinus]
MAPIPRKSLPKRLTGLDPSLIPLVESLLAAKDDIALAAAISAALSIASSTGIAKSDLHHWTAVLNRFDTVLGAFVADANAVPKETVLAVLDMSRLLWDNCTSRTLYSSFEHVIQLLKSKDVDIVNAALHFLVRPPQRQSKPKAAKAALAPAHDTLITLASRWGAKEDGLDLAGLIKEIKQTRSVSEKGEGMKGQQRTLNKTEGDADKSANSEMTEEDSDLSPFSFQFYWSPSTTLPTPQPLNFNTKDDSVETTAAPPSAIAGAAENTLAMVSEAVAPNTPSPATFETPVKASRPMYEISSARSFSTPSAGLHGSSSSAATPSTPFVMSAVAGFSTPSGNLGSGLGVPYSPAPLPEKREGLVTIHVPCVFQTGLSEAEFVERVLKEYDVSPAHHFDVFHRARCAFSKRDPVLRKKLVMMRVLALCVSVSLLTEDVCQSKFFLYEPDLPVVLADIVGAPTGTHGIEYNLQAASFYALESISRIKSRAMDVLNAVGASVNHGILVSVTRRVISILETTDVVETVDFLEAYYSFLSQLVNTSVGGSMVVASGIIQVIVKAFQVHTFEQMRNIAKFVTFLDLMIYSFPAAFTAFSACNGVEMLVTRIKREVGLCLESKASSADSVVLNDISFVHVAFLRSLLKYIMHMMQISGMAETLRNLIETSLPHSILLIFESANFFGANILGLAINIMSTFIHNEPASLPILQESKLPQTLLAVAHSGSYPLSAEVISALPNAFGAICLNQAGLDAFVAANPLPKFLRLLLNQDPHVRAAFYDRDMPNVIGGSVDELVRHHPSLKESTMETVLQVAREVVEFGKTVREEEASLHSLRGIHKKAEEVEDQVMGEASAVSGPSSIVAADVAGTDGEEEKKESRIGTLIDILARFLEGLFQNPAHSKEFVRLGGCDLLVELYTLPTLPVDFALSTTSGYSLLFLFRMLMDGSSATVVPILQEALKTALDRVSEFVEYSEEKCWSLESIDFTDATPEVCAKAQGRFRSFITLECIIRLVADMFSSHNLSHSRSVAAIILAFTGKGEEILPLLSKLQRACLFENALLKNSVPKAWYEMNPKKPAAANGTTPASTGSALSRQASSMNINGTLVDDRASDHQLDLVDEEAINGKDYRMMNTYFFKEFMTQIPTLLTGMMQGVVRVLTTKPISVVTNRKPGQQVLEAIAKSVTEISGAGGCWPRLEQLPWTHGTKIAFLISVLTLIEGMMTDKRNQGALQTPFVVAFDKCGGLEGVLSITGTAWETVCSCMKGDMSTEEDKERLVSLFQLLEKCLCILAISVDMKALHNSPFTTTIQGKEKDRANPDFFDAYEHLVSMRLRILPIAARIWDSEEVTLFSSGKPGANLWKPLLGMLGQILKAEGEVSPRSGPTGEAGSSSASSSGFSFTSPLAALLGRGHMAAPQPVVPDAARVDQLVDMGYPRGAAETALIRCGNNLMRAVDYILSHPSLITDALAAQSAAASSATRAEPTAPATSTNEAGPSSLEANVTASQNTVSESQPDAGPSGTTGNELSTVNAAEEESDDDDDDDEDEDEDDEDEDADEDAMDEEMDEEDALAQALSMSVAPADASATPASTEGAAGDVSMSEATEGAETNAVDKGKGKAEEAKSALQNLNELRSEFSKKAIHRSLELLDRIDFITFDLKDLLCMIGKDDMSGIATALFVKVEESLRASLAESAEALQHLPMELHMMALMLHDALFLKGMEDARMQFYESLVKFFEASVTKLAVDSAIPKWLSPAILIVESAVSEWDEKRLSAHLSTLSPSTEDPASSSLSSESSAQWNSERVLEPMIHLLKVNALDSDSLHAILRVVVRITRSEKSAADFVAHDGLKLLFKSERLGEFPAQASFMIVILRHLVESKKELASSMEVEVTNWFKTARSKDIASYLKGNAALACRDSELFIQVTQALCHLPLYDAKQKSPSIALKPKVEERVLTLESTEAEKDLSKDVMNFLMNSLIECKSTTSPVASADPEDEKLSRAQHFKRGYILQALTELISSFGVCKSHFVTFSKHGGKGTPFKSSRHPVLNHLLSDLLPLEATNEDDSDPLMKRKIMESSWSAILITKLCTGSATADDKAVNEQHQMICKTVVESISRSMKDALASTETADIRYGRFYGLAELCQSILTIRYPPQTSKIAPSQNPHLSATKTMLEKGYANTLTTMLAEIDAFHPRAKMLTSAVLKPLENLTKMAVRIAKLPANAEKATPAKKSASNKMVVESEGESTDLTSSEDERGGQESENEEISNIYRNSALNMYNMQPEDVDMDDISDSDDEGGEEFDDDEFDDEFSGDEGDGEDDDDSDPEDDMEIVVPQPYHGGHEEVDSTDNEGGGENDEMMWEDEYSSEGEGNEDEIAIHADEEQDNDDDDEDDDNDDEDEDEDPEQQDDGEEEGDDENEDDNSEDEDDLVIPFDENDEQLSEEGVPNERANRRRRYIWDNATDGFDSDLFDRPIPLNRPSGAQEELHPLLANMQQNGPMVGASRGTQSNGRNGLLSDMDWQSFLQTLAGPRAVEQIQALERNGQPFRIEIQSNGVPVGDFRDIFRRGIDPAASTSEVVVANADTTPEDRALISLHNASPVQTSLQRWTYEARLLFGAEYADVAVRLQDKTLALLTPAALEEKLAREKEEAEKKIRDEEAKRVADEKRREVEAAAAKLKAEEEEQERIRKEAEEKERLEKEAAEKAKAEAEMAERAEAAGSSSSAMEVSETVAEATNPDVAAATGDAPAAADVPAPPARVFVELGGQTIDITDSGIDPEFLAALPEDLRMEVLNQHLQEQRQRTTAVPILPDNPDMSEFLNALPPDIRNEVLRSQQQQPSSSNSRNAQGAGAVEMDPASFLATLDPTLRQAVMMEQDNDFLQGLPPAFMAEASATMRSISRLQQGIRQMTRRTGSVADEAVPAPAPQKVLKKSTRDVVQLVEKPALFTLLRLLFVPEPANKETLNRLLLNLCENSRSRLDLMSMFLSILWDGNADFILLDKNFSQMTIKGKGKVNTTPKKVVSFSTAQSFESIPNLIVQRCLETLIFLVGTNDQIVIFFLQENEQFANTFGKYRPHYKKGKGKEKAIANIYPVVVLLSLVERPIFLSNPVLLEQLVQLLTFVLRPISSLGVKPKDAATIGQTPATGQPPEVGTEPSTSAIANADASATTGEKTPSVPVGPELAEDVLKVPMIPDQYVRAIVQVLTVGECSIKTFQYTLSMIQHLAPLNNNREIITNELISHSQASGASIVKDLDNVAEVLSSAGVDIDVNSGPLAKFSTPASEQAKFLRVLKTLDYIHSKLRLTGPKSENTTVKPVVTTETAGESSTPMEVIVPEPTPEEALAAIYSKVAIPHLWSSLGSVMTIVSENDELTRVGTVLLPLIEAFMVISKPFVSQKSAGGPARLIHSSSFSAKGKESATRTNEELFNQFTEDHKKILNVMVRNNPSLMSGSFSLLIQNPKVLEFDNKRTYFNLQLHKKSAREHYGSLPLNVRRAMVFEDSYHQLHGRSGDEIKFGKLNIRFHDEEGVDAGGVTREFFQVLARQMFNPDYALFKPSAVDKVTYQPNRSSWINPDHLLYFRFVGRIIGKAIYDGRLLDAYFTRSFYKCMLEIPVDWKDMEAIDPEFHKSLQWMLQNDITDVIDMTFSTEVDDFGVERIIDLKPNGRNIPVTEENKQEYVSLITEQKLTKAIQQQIDAFLGGFQDIIPKDLIKIFNEQELELLISGLPDIDIDDMKNNTEYQNYSQASPQIQWFWRAVRSFSQEERAKLIQFATGTSKVPLEGFKSLEGSNGIQKFQIHKDFASKLRLPSAHTCFNQIDLPEYDCYEDLRANLLTAISECATGFGFV